jgi:hypothetical protein
MTKSQSDQSRLQNGGLLSEHQQSETYFLNVCLSALLPPTPGKPTGESPPNSELEEIKQSPQSLNPYPSSFPIPVPHLGSQQSRLR